MNRRPTLRALVAALPIVSACLILALLSVRFAVIPSVSMLPTLSVGERIVVNLWAGRLLPIHRGDNVVFQDPGEWLSEATPSENPLNIVTDALTGIDSGRLLVKRVIALSGDVVASKDGVLTVNGVVVDEPYVNEGIGGTKDFVVTVPADSFWAMGDNRAASNDSRYNGPVPMSSLVGLAVLFLP